MKVLMVESHPGMGWSAARRLEQAGHSVAYCDTRDTGVPCRGLDGIGVCPLDDDVSVAVVARFGGDLHAGEHGALCAARQRIPIVTTAPHVDAGPFSALATAAGHDLVGACERAAESGARHAAAVERELVRLGVVAGGELVGDDPEVAVDVRRGHRKLSMRLRVPEGDRREPAIVKAATEALRRYDGYTPVIDVSVVH